MCAASLHQSPRAAGERGQKLPHLRFSAVASCTQVLRTAGNRALAYFLRGRKIKGKIHLFSVSFLFFNYCASKVGICAPLSHNYFILIALSVGAIAIYELPVPSSTSLPSASVKVKGDVSVSLVHLIATYLPPHEK